MWKIRVTLSLPIQVIVRPLLFFSQFKALKFAFFTRKSINFGRNGREHKGKFWINDKVMCIKSNKPWFFLSYESSIVESISRQKRFLFSRQWQQVPVFLFRQWKCALAENKSSDNKKQRTAKFKSLARNFLKRVVDF